MQSLRLCVQMPWTWQALRALLLWGSGRGTDCMLETFPRPESLRMALCTSSYPFQPRNGTYCWLESSLWVDLSALLLTSGQNLSSPKYKSYKRVWTPLAAAALEDELPRQRHLDILFLWQWLLPMGVLFVGTAFLLASFISSCTSPACPAPAGPVVTHQFALAVREKPVNK